MSQRLYILFKFPDENFNPGKIAEKINAKFPGIATVNDGDIDLDGTWFGYITDASEHCLYSVSPLYCFYFWCYWNAVLDDLKFREYVMTLCEAMGVKEWWYIEETSMDLYQGMPAEEFEAVLASAIGIEDFDTPTYFPASSHHLFHDSSQKVRHLMSLT